MATLAVTKMRQESVDTSGKKPVSFRLFGDAGAAATNDIGAWVQMEGVERKVFLLYPATGLQNADMGAACSVEIHAAMELDGADAVANTQKIVLGTLTKAAPSLVIDNPWPYLRAFLKAQGNMAVQAGVYGVGI